MGIPRFTASSFSPASAFSSAARCFCASDTSSLVMRICFLYRAATSGLNCLKGVDVSLPTGPEMMSGVRASSMRIESTSSMIVYACPRCTRCASECTMLSRR